MREPRGVHPVQEADQRLQLLSAGGKAARTLGACNILTAPPGRQDFTTRGVKFATTGVEIGGHAGHLRGRRQTEQRRLRHPTYDSSQPPATATRAPADPQNPWIEPPRALNPAKPPPARPAQAPTAARHTAPNSRNYKGFTASSGRPQGPFKRAAPPAALVLATSGHLASTGRVEFGRGALARRLALSAPSRALLAPVEVLLIERKRGSCWRCWIRAGCSSLIASRQVLG
jgi:hypothetical protein